MRYQEIQKLIGKAGYNEVFEVLFKKISEVDFPIYSSVINDEDAVKKLKKIAINFKPTYDNKPYSYKLSLKTDIIDFKFGDKYLSIYTGNDEEMDMIIAHFSGKCNMHAKRIEMSGTPYEIWSKPEHRRKVLQYILKNKMDLTIKTLDEINYKFGKACTYFRLSVMLSLLIHFQPKSVLDLCSGWGERLLGSVLKNVKYVGFDPSECQKPVYKKIIKLMDAKKSARVHSIGAEFMDDRITPSDMFDMVLLPPPFFTLEIYNNDPTQSVNVFPEFEQWLHQWLFKIIKLSWAHLNDGGNYIIYVADYANIDGVYSYTERTVLYCLAFLPHCKFNGSFGRTSDKKKYLSFFCFEKDTSVSEETRDKYEKLFVEKYGHLKFDV